LLARHSRRANEILLRIEIHRTIPDDPTLREQWNALVERMPSPEVFYTYEWAASVARAYCGTPGPWLLLAYEAHDLKGIAALATEPNGGQVNWLAGTTADYCDFVSTAADREPLVDAVFAELRKAGLPDLALANLPSDSPTVPALRKFASKHKYHAFLRTAYLCAQVKLGTEEDRRALKSKLNGRKIFRRGTNFLNRQGSLSLIHRTTWDTIGPLLNEFSTAHIARFLVTGRISNHVDAKRRVFLFELAKALSASGWLVLSQLNSDDRTVAWNYGFRFRDSWFWYQPTFESEFEQVSPGYCLLSKMIAESCDTPDIQVVDLGLGAEGYKERFANQTRKTLHAVISISATRTTMAALRYGASRAATISPMVEARIRSSLRRLENLRDAYYHQPSPLAAARGRAARWISNRDEVRFYQWALDPSLEETPRGTMGTRLASITLELLARAAMQYEGDSGFQAYLLRAANRRKSAGLSGYALLAPDDRALHFAWTAPFEGFFMAELKVHLSAPSANAALIFDCWTPAPVRGRGSYGIAIELLAQQLLHEGCDPWIFSAGSNQASIQGLAKSSFQHRYSMIRRKTLMIQRVTKVPCPDHIREVPVGS